MTAAQMRKMMEGVVLYGSGRPAQLNGYSAGGKTGTAQKVDPATHLYSKTMHIASFAVLFCAGQYNPVIAVAVVIDNPRKGPSYYGTAVSAPVFGEVAQQVLEYLGVPHDVEVHAPRYRQPRRRRTFAEDDSDEQGDVNALYAAINDLPSDDPLRAQPAQANAASQPAQPTAKPAVASNRECRGRPKRAKPGVRKQHQSALHEGTAPTALATKAVVVTDQKKLKVPSLVGLPVLRQVVMQAAAAKL